MKVELMPISLILSNNFPTELKFKSNELFMISDAKDDTSAFQSLKNNIKRNILYNVILSGHKTVEKAYGLLKSFLDYNIENEYYFDNRNFRFFLIIENEYSNKKMIY
jgi:uncharacterized membrane protein